MFDEVTRRERGRGAGRRARFVLGSTVLQALVLAGAVATAAFGAKPVAERLVPVTFVPPPPRAPAAPAPEQAPGPQGTPMPAARPAPPRAQAKLAPPPPKLVQPRELPEAVPPAPATPPEPEPEPGPGSGEGVVGGAPGGGGGAPVPGAVGALGAPGPAVEDAPEDTAHRNLKPRLADPRCMDRSKDREPELMNHPELAGRVVAVEFQVGPSGALSGFRSLDRDLGPVRWALWSAIQRCRWTPGTDADGRPSARTASLRFRFE